MSRQCQYCQGFPNCRVSGVTETDTPEQLNCTEYKPASGGAAGEAADQAAQQTTTSTQPETTAGPGTPAAGPAAGPGGTPTDTGNRTSTPAEGPGTPAAGPGEPGGVPDDDSDILGGPGGGPAAGPGETPGGPGTPPDTSGSGPGTAPETEGNTPKEGGITDEPDMSWDPYKNPVITRYFGPKKARLMMEADKVGIKYDPSGKDAKALHQKLLDWFEQRQVESGEGIAPRDTSPADDTPPAQTPEPQEAPDPTPESTQEASGQPEVHVEHTATGEPTPEMLREMEARKEALEAAVRRAPGAIAPGCPPMDPTMRAMLAGMRAETIGAMRKLEANIAVIDALLG